MAGDMEALRALIARVQVGWRADVYGHGVNEGHSPGVITEFVDDYYGSGPTLLRTLDKAVRSQGRVYRTGAYTWPKEGDDFVVEGNTLREYRNPPPHLGKPHRITVEVTFSGPEHTCSPGIGYGCDAPDCDGDSD